MAFNRSSHRHGTQGGSSSSHIMLCSWSTPPPPEKDWYSHDLPVSRNRLFSFFSFFFSHPSQRRLPFGSKNGFTLSEWGFVDWAATIPPPNTLTLHRESRPCSSPPRCSSVRLIEKLSARMGLRSTPTHHPERLRGWVPVRSLTALSLSLYLLRQRASRNPPDPQL